MLKNNLTNRILPELHVSVNDRIYERVKFVLMSNNFSIFIHFLKRETKRKINLRSYFMIFV